jgi:hypothetical protein
MEKQGRLERKGEVAICGKRREVGSSEMKEDEGERTRSPVMSDCTEVICVGFGRILNGVS